MNALDELITKGKAMLDGERQAAEVAASEQAAARTADRTARISAVREVLGIDEATFEKFAPEYTEGWSPNVTLTFRGEAIVFSVDRANGGYAVRTGNGSTGHIEYLAREMAQIVDKHEHLKANTINELKMTIDAWWATHYINARRPAVWDMPEVQAQRVNCLMRVYTSGVLDRESHQIENWLGYTAGLVTAEPLLAEMRDELKAKMELLLKRERLLRCIEKRLHPETDEVMGLDDAWDEDRGRYSDVVTREEVDAYRAAVVRDGMLGDAEVKAALAKREQQMVDAELQADVERKRVLLEAELFRPFAYYTVHYGVLGVDEDDARMVATETFEALADAPGDDGYWTTVHVQRVKPTFVALIERHEVTTVIEMLRLRWRHRLQRSTAFGSIYVAPQVAEVTR